MSGDGQRRMVDVRPLLARERACLVELLTTLKAEEWNAPTPCPGWSVHDLVIHLVHDDIRILSGGRDQHLSAWVPAESLDELIVGLDTANNAWVRAVAPVMSPRLATQLLTWLGPEYQAYLRSLIPDAIEAQVSWAGADPQPNWLDVAREFSERWVHQQQIRHAVRRPGCDEPTLLDAVVATFTWAIPTVLPAREPGTELQLDITGALRRRWSFVRQGNRWMHAPPSSRPHAMVEVSADTFWRRAVRMLTKDAAMADAVFSGDLELGGAVFALRGAIVSDQIDDW